MDFKVDALMLKHPFMEGPFFILASFLIIIFALPAKAEPPIDHSLNVYYPLCNVDFFDTYFRSKNEKVSYGRCIII